MVLRHLHTRGRRTDSVSGPDRIAPPSTICHEGRKRRGARAASPSVIGSPRGARPREAQGTLRGGGRRGARAASPSVIGSSRERHRRKAQDTWRGEGGGAFRGGRIGVHVEHVAAFGEVAG